MTVILQKCIECLSAEGIKIMQENEGFILFKYQGKYIYIEHNESDTNFLRFILPNFWSIESSDARIKVLETANQVSSEMKVINFEIAEDNVHAVCEIFISEDGFLPVIIDRCLNVLIDGILKFKIDYKNC